MEFHIACSRCELVSLLVLPLQPHWTPSWQEGLYSVWETIIVVIMSVCKEFCEGLHNLPYCLGLRHNIVHWQEKLIFTRVLWGKTFWGCVKYICWMTRFTVVEVLAVYQTFTILRWFQCNLLSLLYIKTEKDM